MKGYGPAHRWVRLKATEEGLLPSRPDTIIYTVVRQNPYRANVVELSRALVETLAKDEEGFRAVDEYITGAFVGRISGKFALAEPSDYRIEWKRYDEETGQCYGELVLNVPE